MRRPLNLLALAGFIALAIALTAIGTGGAYRTGHHGPSAQATTDLGALWAIPPFEVSALLILAGLYALRVRRVGGVSGLRQVSFHAGVAVILIAVCSPLGGVAQQGLLTAHMLQHTLIGAIAPLLMLLGMPRAFLEDALGPGTRRVLERLQHPLVAFPLWALSTVVWLLPDIHHVVLESRPLWIVAADLVPADRAAALGAGRRVAPRPGVVQHRASRAATWWASGSWASRSPTSTGSRAPPSTTRTPRRAAAWGIEPLEDQANAGTVMMVLHCLLAFGAITILFFRQAREGELRQRMLEAGIDPVRVAEATRAGTGRELARAHGVADRTRAGID